jgi:hypothetical protein
MRRVHSLFEIEFPAGWKLVLHLSVSSNFPFFKVIQYQLISFTSEMLSPEAAPNSSLFLETGYPGKVTTCYSIHLLPLSHNSSRSNQSGHVCCRTIMNHFQHHSVCAINRYRFCCCRLQRCLCLSSLLLGTFLHVVLPFSFIRLGRAYS